VNAERRSDSAFITLEGIEGVGKSTNLAFLREQLEALGHRVVVTREPGGTALGERIREWVLDEDHGGLSAEVEALLMFAARAQHLDKVIRPALADGAWVICDRFTDATLAYQGGGRGAPADWLENLKQGVHQGLEPDLTLLLDAPIELGFERIGSRARDNFEREDLAFFERVRATYLALAEQYPERIRRIDASQPLDAVKARLNACLDRFLRDRGDDD